MHKVIHAGIASFGMSGQIFHAPFLDNNPHYKLCAIVERHKNNSRSKYPHTQLYRSFEAMLSDASIDLIVVNTPVQTHFQYAKMALLANRAVVVEKPFTVNAEEAAELKTLAKNTNTFLSVYQNRRYDGDFLKVKEVLAHKQLGEIKEAELSYNRYRPGMSGKEHKENNIPGAGVLHDLGTHLIDQALQLFGFPHAVFADIDNMRQGAASNDYFELLLFYPHHMRVRLKASVFVKEPGYSFVLHGTQGSFVQQRSDMQEEMLNTGVKPTIESWIETPATPDGLLHITAHPADVRKETRSGIGNYMNYYEAVYESLVYGAPNPVPASDAVKTMRIIDAALRSAAEKNVQSF